MEGQIICPLGSGLNLAEVSAVTAANPSQTAILVLEETITGEFTWHRDVRIKITLVSSKLINRNLGKGGVGG